MTVVVRQQAKAAARQVALDVALTVAAAVFRFASAGFARLANAMEARRSW